MEMEENNEISLHRFLDHLNFLITNGNQRGDNLSSDLFDTSFIEEIKDFSQRGVFLYFGKTLKDLKCVIVDENVENATWTIWTEYIGPKNLQIRRTDLPLFHIEEQVYRSINELVKAVKVHVQEIFNYINILNLIDTQCIVKEPITRTFHDNYRVIELADKIWLRVEVSPSGSAKTLTLLGQHQPNVERLLLDWDHDENIVSNILRISYALNDGMLPEPRNEELPDCAICYCVELLNDRSVPQPLCRNPMCGAYFHTSCLQMWFAASEGLHLRFGDGTCPRCSHYIQC